METNFTFKSSKLLFLIMLFISSIASFSQVKGIVLESKKNQQKVIIAENKRVKIRTIDGKKIIGYYSIVDDKTIKVNDILVPLDSITTIQQRSLFNSIARPILFTTGTLALGFGIAGAAVGGYGYLATLVFVPTGLPMVLVPSFSNKHHNEKWIYTIESVE
jgi:hypothetical protein